MLSPLVKCNALIYAILERFGPKYENPEVNARDEDSGEYTISNSITLLLFILIFLHIPDERISVANYSRDKGLFVWGLQVECLIVLLVCIR